MFQAHADSMEAGTAQRNQTVGPNTVPPRVQFRDRQFTDKWWGVIYALSYIAFLSTGFFLVSKSHARYEIGEDGTMQISAYHLEDAKQCCSGDVANADSDWGVCAELNNNGRRLISGNSRFQGDEGMFDVFNLAPEIIVVVVGLTLGLAFAWVVALRFFAKPIVILSEICKIVIFIVIGIYQERTSSKVICFLFAAGLLGYAYWARNKILFAAKIITHSTIAMKENPSIFIGGIFTQLFFAGNAALFVYFFAESFNVAELREVSYREGGPSYCEFVFPAYVGRIDTYLGLSYLWTILLFDKMRLYMIATVVGSWHFHPNDKPSIWLAMKNIGSSFGTLSVSALISSIAEYINRMLSEDAWTSWISPTVCVTAPLHLLMCCFGTCLKTIINMLTKFAVILHVFTGAPFVGSGKKVFDILSRHFKGGFVTEVTSKSVLNLGSYAFTVAIAMLTWYWVDAEFDCGTLSQEGENTWFILYFILVLFNCWYPVLGIYLLILIDLLLQRAGRENLEDGREGFNHLWIPPFTAAFVGCIAMLMFRFLSSIFLDTIDTLFLCFAIDKDNNVDQSNNEFTSLVKEIPGYTEAQSISSTDSPAIPVADVVDTK